MTFHRLVQTRHLHDGFRVVVPVNRMQLLVLQHAGRVYILDNACPHQGFPLAKGALQGDRLVCPRHGFAFHLRDGDCFQANCRLRTFRPRYDGNWLGVELDDD